MTKTLTEQWKNGELDVLFDVYVKIPNEGVCIRKIYYLNQYLGTKLSDEIEILAPVPSYEEWEELRESNDGLSKLMFKSLMNRFVKADEERERLEEQLNIATKALKEAHTFPATTTLKEWCQERLKEIDEVVK